LQGNADALAGFAESERQQLSALLMRLVANLEQAVRPDGDRQADGAPPVESDPG
jgi:hypothetical protein